MNHQDLLFTNKFQGKPLIEFQNDTKTRDRMNVLKTIDRPFPKRYNRNYEPILSNEVRDIAKDRYKKHRITTVCLDSRDRDTRIFPKPNDYLVCIAGELHNIVAIKPIAVDFDNIFLVNNVIRWCVDGGTMFQMSIPDGVYSTEELAIVMMENMNQVVNTENNGKVFNFYVSINPMTHEVQIINRFEALEVLAIQTILDPGDDIFQPAVVPIYNSGAFYVTVNQKSNNISLFNNLTPNQPLVLTNLPNVGGISGTLINFREFYVDPPPESFLGTYSFFDLVDINGKLYPRYELIPKSIPFPHNSLKDSSELAKIDELDVLDLTITASNSENIILSPSLVTILNADQTNFVGVFISQVEKQNKYQIPRIGRAQEFIFNFASSPLLRYFSWDETGEKSRFILSNQSVFNRELTKCLNIDRDEFGRYYFRLEPYIFLKLTIPSQDDDKVAGNIMKTQAARDTNNQANDVFAKILLSNPIRIVSSTLEYLEVPLEALTDIMVTFIDRKGNVLDLKCENVVTLEVVEAVNVLKDTLLDSRHGEANDTGYRRF